MRMTISGGAIVQMSASEEGPSYIVIDLPEPGTDGAYNETTRSKVRINSTYTDGNGYGQSLGQYVNITNEGLISHRSPDD